MTAIDKSGNVSKAFSRMKKLLNLLQKHMTFAQDNRFGFLTFNPADVGTGLRAQVCHPEYKSVDTEPEYKV